MKKKLIILSLFMSTLGFSAEHKIVDLFWTPDTNSIQAILFGALHDYVKNYPANDPHLAGLAVITDGAGTSITFSSTTERMVCTMGLFGTEPPSYRLEISSQSPLLILPWTENALSMQALLYEALRLYSSKTKHPNLRQYGPQIVLHQGFEILFIFDSRVTEPLPATEEYQLQALHDEKIIRDTLAELRAREQMASLERPSSLITLTRELQELIRNIPPHAERKQLSRADIHVLSHEFATHYVTAIQECRVTGKRFTFERILRQTALSLGWSEQLIRIVIEEGLLRSLRTLPQHRFSISTVSALLFRQLTRSR